MPGTGPIPLRRDLMIDALARMRDAGGADLVVVGGGVTGAGVAVEAAARGLRTVLLEAGDLASGTSSKSSKLVHGGLRYLRSGDAALVREALRERHRLMRNAPHLVTPLPFLIPILTRDGVVSRRLAKALGSALWMYDLAGGWRIGRRHHRISAARARAHFPTADPDRLTGGFLYWDAQADDARLTLALARTAADLGVVVLTRTPVRGIERSADGDLTGVWTELDGQPVHIPTRCVVNATGVWAGRVEASAGVTDPTAIRPARGVHLSLPWESAPVDVAVVIPVPGDRRSLFLVPTDRRADGRFRSVYVGTTDTDHSGDLDDPQVEPEDVAYVLRALSHALGRRVEPAEVCGTWAGLRPLVAGTGRTADLSRRHLVRRAAPGLVTVTGGKLTTYRPMAAEAVDAARADLDGRGRRRSRTARLPLHGSPGRRGRPAGIPDHLWARYGTDATEVMALAASDPDLARPLHPALPYARAEVVHAARAEMALEVADVLERRTRAHLLDHAAARAAAPDVADLMAATLGWDAATRDRSLADYLAAADRRLAAAHLPEDR